MLSRLGWIGAALAVGLLLQIPVQIRWLRWLPDFPVYLGLALLAGGAAVIAAPVILVATARKVPTGEAVPARAAWPTWLAIVGFVTLTIVHVVLAVGSSSTAVEWWRDTLLWPALLFGVTACVLSGPRWWALLLIWPLGEAGASILGCWYAPNAGESQSLRAYLYVLIAGLVSLVTLLACGVAKPRWFRNWSLWGHFAMSLAFPLICLVQPETEHAQSLMLGLAVLRLGLLMVAVDRWLAMRALTASVVSAVSD